MNSKICLLITLNACISCAEPGHTVIIDLGPTEEYTSVRVTIDRRCDELTKNTLAKVNNQDLKAESLGGQPPFDSHLVHPCSDAIFTGNVYSDDVGNYRLSIRDGDELLVEAAIPTLREVRKIKYNPDSDGIFHPGDAVNVEWFPESDGIGTISTGADYSNLMFVASDMEKRVTYNEQTLFQELEKTERGISFVIANGWEGQEDVSGNLRFIPYRSLGRSFTSAHVEDVGGEVELWLVRVSGQAEAPMTILAE